MGDSRLRAIARWRSSHAVVLASCFLVTMCFGVLTIAGADDLALLAICVGFLPAWFLLRTSTRPSGGETVLWWMGAALLVLFTVHIASSAVEERQRMIAAQSCVLKPLDFDNDSVETVTVEWLPPRVQCRYGYSYQNSEVLEWESRWWVYWPFALVPMTGLVIVGLAMQTRRARSTAVPTPDLATR